MNINSHVVTVRNESIFLDLGSRSFSCFLIKTGAVLQERKEQNKPDGVILKRRDDIQPSSSRYVP